MYLDRRWRRRRIDSNSNSGWVEAFQVRPLSAEGMQHSLDSRWLTGVPLLFRMCWVCATTVVAVVVAAAEVSTVVAFASLIVVILNVVPAVLVELIVAVSLPAIMAAASLIDLLAMRYCYWDWPSIPMQHSWNSFDIVVHVMWILANWCLGGRERYCSGQHCHSIVLN